MTRSKKFEYKIGDWVEVGASVSFVNIDGYRRAERVWAKTPWKGQVVGATQKMSGYYDRGSGYNSWTGECDDGDGFIVDEIFDVILIRRGFLNKPVYALAEDIRSTKVPTRGLPIKWVSPKKWTKEQREELRQIMKDHPRDEDGRWA